MNVTAARLAEAMEFRQIDQTKLAEGLGVTQGAISKILAGRTANSRLTPKIAVYLGVPLAWLLGQVDSFDQDEAEQSLYFEEREWLDLLRGLTPDDRAAVLRLTRSLATSAASATLQGHGRSFRSAPKEVGLTETRLAG